MLGWGITFSVHESKLSHVAARFEYQEFSKCALLLGRVSAVCMCSVVLSAPFGYQQQCKRLVPYTQLDGSSDPTGKEAS